MFDYISELKQFDSLTPKEKIDYLDKAIDEICLRLQNRTTNLNDFTNQVALFKTKIPIAQRVSGGLFKKEFFDFLTNSLKKIWETIERCSSQILRYPALSVFANLYANLKGLNPYYTLEASLQGTIRYGTLPDINTLQDCLNKDKEHLMFLMNYIQFASVLRFLEDPKDRINVIKSATNFVQLTVLSIYNFLFTVPFLKRADFLSWLDLFQETLDKALKSMDILLKEDIKNNEERTIKISQSSIFSLYSQLYQLKARYLNEDIDILLNQSYLELSKSMQELEKLMEDQQHKDMIRMYYFQQKTLLLETRFYQVLNQYVTSHYRNSIFVGDRKSDKESLTISALKHEIEEILHEIKVYVDELLSGGDQSSIGIYSELISKFSKISFAGYIYGLIDNVEEMEELIKVRRLDLGDPKLSLILARYWLLKWYKIGGEKKLKRSIAYYERAGETYEILFNNIFVPIYCYSLIAVLYLSIDEPIKAENYLIKADSKFNDAKDMGIISEKKENYYLQFREQLNKKLENGEIEKPLRFDKPFNVIDFNTWLTEKFDWREKIEHLPEPFPFHLEQQKIIEFEFI